MKANDRNDHDATDILCGECKFVVATLHAEPATQFALPRWRQERGTKRPPPSCPAWPHGAIREEHFPSRPVRRRAAFRLNPTRRIASGGASSSRDSSASLSVDGARDISFAPNETFCHDFTHRRISFGAGGSRLLTIGLGKNAERLCVWS